MGKQKELELTEKVWLAEEYLSACFANKYENAFIKAMVNIWQTRKGVALSCAPAQIAI